MRVPDESPEFLGSLESIDGSDTKREKRERAIYTSDTADPIENCDDFDPDKTTLDQTTANVI